MSEDFVQRLGVMGVLRTEGGGFVFLEGPLDEDPGKREKMSTDPFWVDITPGMLGSLSEAVKPQEAELNINDMFVAALIRSGKKEQGLKLDPDQIEHPLLKLKNNVHQRRRDGTLASFEVLLANVFLKETQQRRLPRAVQVSSGYALEYLEDHQRNVRPSTISAVRQMLEAEKMKQ